MHDHCNRSVMGSVWRVVFLSARRPEEPKPEDLTLLKSFDLDGEYGPCVGTCVCVPYHPPVSVHAYCLLLQSGTEPVLVRVYCPSLQPGTHVENTNSAGPPPDSSRVIILYLQDQGSVEEVDLTPLAPLPIA